MAITSLNCEDNMLQKTTRSRLAIKPQVPMMESALMMKRRRMVGILIQRSLKKNTYRVTRVLTIQNAMHGVSRGQSMMTMQIWI